MAGNIPLVDPDTWNELVTIMASYGGYISNIGASVIVTAYSHKYNPLSKGVEQVFLKFSLKSKHYPLFIQEVIILKEEIESMAHESICTEMDIALTKIMSEAAAGSNKDSEKKAKEHL
jgi:hypothetical protein